jgi:hypothetical protein
MKDAVRWVLAIAAAALVVALIAWARGNPHHRGIDVGSIGPSSHVAALVVSVHR